MPQKPFETLDLSGKYIIHDVPIYCHNHPTHPDGMNACVKELEVWLKAFDLDDFDLGGGGTGDMTKAVYDADNDGICDASETLEDGTNTVTAAEIRNHLDNHPSVGGYIAISGTHSVTSAEVNGHLFICSATCFVTLPDISTLPDNARLTLFLSDYSQLTITPFTSDMILMYNVSLSDGQGISTSSGQNAITLRKYPNGWIAESFVSDSWSQVGGGE